MGGLWPDDRPTVATGDHKQALANGRGSVVGRFQDPPFDRITHALELANKLIPGARNRHAVPSELEAALTTLGATSEQLALVGN
ncbi:hypothetical protein D3C75_870020 [compost metagenome]